MLLDVRSLRRALVAIACFGAACGGNTSTPSVTTPTVSATVSIGGLQGQRLQPGFKIRVTATLRAAAGTTEDCTATAAWSSPSDAVLRATGAQAGEFLIVGTGDGTITATCASVTGTLSVHIDLPTSWPIGGRVVAAADGAPIPHATVSFDGIAPVESGDDGRYVIETPDAQVHRVLVSAQGYVLRETFVRGREVRELDFTLIADHSPFPWQLYREMGRNAKEAPQFAGATPLRHWTQDPNVFIWTTWKDTGQPVNNVDWLVAEIRRVIPQLTGFRFKAGTIESGPSERPLTPGWIKVQFDHSGNWGQLGTDPGWVQFGSDHNCNSYAVVHEFGHAMGYWHNSMIPSIMGGGPAQCIQYNLWPLEQIVANTMYSRPSGNVEPDRDPQGTALLVPPPAGDIVILP